MGVYSYPVTAFNGAPTYSADMMRHMVLPFTIPFANSLNFTGISYVLRPSSYGDVFDLDGLTVSIQPHAGYYSTGSDLYGGYLYTVDSVQTLTITDNTNTYNIVLTIPDPSTGAGDTTSPVFTVLPAATQLPTNSIIYGTVTAGQLSRSYISYYPTEGYAAPSISQFNNIVSSLPNGTRVTDLATNYVYEQQENNLNRVDANISFSYVWSDPIYIDAVLTPLAAASGNNADTGGATHMLTLYIHWLVIGSSSHNAWDKTVFAHLNGWQAVDEIWGYLENDDTDHINYDMRFVCDGSDISIDASSNYVLSQGHTYRGGLLIPVRRN